MRQNLRVLLVEDSDDDAELVLRELKRHGIEPDYARVQTRNDMDASLSAFDWDVILSDYSMPRFTGPEAFRLLTEKGLDIPFIIVSGTVGEEIAVKAMKLGVQDYLLKGNLTRLVPAIERELREKDVRRQRRQAMEELGRSESRYRMLFEGSPLPMWVFDRDTLAFLAVNDAAVRHYGYSRDDFARMTLDDIRPTEDVPGLRSHLVVAPKIDEGSTWRHRTKSGATILVDIRAHDIDFSGRQARLVVVNDVTEKVRAEEELRAKDEQLRQAQKMEAIGRLAGGVAHDFNNMLSVILSYAAMMRADLAEDSPMRDGIDEIYGAGKRAADLTRQLLTFSRREVVAPQVLDLNQVVRGLEKILRRVLGEDIELTLALDRDSERLRIDPSHLEQVVMNLVVNARDAMARGGKLRIATANVRLDAQSPTTQLPAKPGHYVELTVSDTGCGMDRATLARIFEPFFTTKDVGKGTGLGLSTLFGIVQRHDGAVRVDSEPGRGTTFHVYFPRTEAPVDAATPSLAPITLSGHETVLLVEDEEQVRAVAHGILRRAGYHVIEVRNPGEALLLCEQRDANIHLLLTDVVMPWMGGPELARRLRPLQPRMRVLCMSGYADDNVGLHGGFDGTIAFVQKPITPELLTRRVREVLDAPPPSSSSPPSARDGDARKAAPRP